MFLAFDYCMLYFRRTPASEPSARHPMNPLRQELYLPKIRRELEEILAIVREAPDGRERHSDPVSAITTEANRVVATPDQTQQLIQPEFAAVSTLPDNPNSADTTQQLYDDALVVITEFGHASPSVLQMWLSIDYARAAAIFERFQKEGLVSSNGRVRHKAFALRSRRPDSTSNANE